MNNRKLIIGIDFDGTCVEHDFPNVGNDCVGAADVLRRLTAAGHKLVLTTMRCNHDFEPCSEQPEIIVKAGNYLDDATNWFMKHGIPLWGIQENPEQKGWTSSPKVYCHILIDDTALGAPVKPDSNGGYCIDWKRVQEMLEFANII